MIRPLNKRKLELAIVMVVVALVCLFLRDTPQPEPPVVSVEPVQPLTLDLPKLNLSDDAKWIMTTAADAYSPRVSVEKLWTEDGESRSR